MNRRTFVRKTGLLSLAAGISSIGSTASTNNEQIPQGETFHFKREIPVGDTYDLIVAGGGPAGASAAICAARLGVKVLLVEATGCLGGIGTSGLVTAFDPMSDGEQLLVGGLMKEIVNTLYLRGCLCPDVTPDIYSKRMHFWTPFQVEGYKLLLDELVAAAGVEVQFFTHVIDADADVGQGKVRGVILNNVEGYRYVTAKTFVDGTGNGVLSQLCGASYQDAGIDTPNIMPATLMSLFSAINFEEYYKGNQYESLQKALADGHFTQHDRLLPGMFRVNRTTANLNGGHMFNLNALRCKDLTDGMMLGRRLVQEYYAFYKKYMPGCENMELITTAAIAGIRESRRVMGEYELNIDDYIARRKFPDQIGVFCKFVDIHPYDTSEEEWERFRSESGQYLANNNHIVTRYKKGESFGIPYGILVPKGWTNLWVAGRCASADVKVQGSIRVQPSCSMMGQAAGTAAVQSIKTGRPANDLNTEKLVETLRKAGANLPQKTLSSKMTFS
ncbi:MAG: FAD-dependent oxidoreductase [Tannerellaceae bacterium]|jgi:hypothetical protein|nr:FAD-dependent oxidoreductase [Tannerellaceae bacterium]